MRAAAGRAINTFYDYHAMHAAGVVLGEPSSEFAGRWCCVARINTRLAGVQIVHFDVHAPRLGDMAIDLVLHLSHFCGG